MKMAKKKMIAAGAIVLLGTAAIALQGATGERAAEGVTAPTAVVGRGDLAITAEAAGIVEPVRVVEVKSKASGEILQLHVETGDVVARGAALAQIDPRDVQNALDQAVADQEVAQVQARTAEAQLARTEQLRGANVVTQQEYENAIQTSANARASLVRAETNLQLARERRGDVSIDAPIAGTVIERTVEVGQIIASATTNVSGGTTLLRMADLSEMQVRALVDETDIGQVSPGQNVAVRVDAYPDRTFTGHVLKIEPQAVVEQNVTMFPVLVRLENLEGLLRPGMNASISVQISERTDVATVPNEAVVAPQDAPGVASALGVDPSTLGPGGRLEAAAGGRGGIVFVLTPSGSEARQVVLGLSDWERSEVIEGLEPGETVYLATVARMEAQQEQRIPGPFGGGR
jgi:HlyD family secretion protein